MTLVREVMSSEVVCVEHESNISDAASLMVQGGFGSVLVTQGKMLLGILTERDVLRAAAYELDLSRASIGLWMTQDPVTTGADLETEEAADLMLSHGFRHLPILEDGELVGIVSLRDLLSARIGRR